MLMPVMNIGKVRMFMRQGIVLMRMAMWLRAIPFKVMRVPMVRIVAVFMRMRLRCMGVGMRVRFRQMQPDAGTHQCCRDPEDDARRIAQHQQCNDRAHKRRDRKVSAGSGGAEMA